MLKLFMTYCLAFISSISFSQITATYKLSGTVISANSGEPIAYGSIKISRINGYLCDSLGNFTIYNLANGQHTLSYSSFGYENKDTVITISDTDINNFTWTIYTNCQKYNKERALKDIQNKKPVILLQGGIAPVWYKTDKEFGIKYKISFYDFGCVAGDYQECLIIYNKTIFKYLDKTYGKEWRSEIRKDAIGLK